MPVAQLPYNGVRSSWNLFKGVTLLELATVATLDNRSPDSACPEYVYTRNMAQSATVPCTGRGLQQCYYLA